MGKRFWLFLGLWMCCFGAGAQSLVEKVINLDTAGSFPNNLVLCNNLMYFSATDSTHGFEPWVSDGTVGGTHLLADIFPGSGNSFPLYLTVDSNTLFFQANDSVHGQELWYSRNDTTDLVLDIYPGNGASLPQNLFVFNRKLYFQADDGVHGSELWVSDGTAAGTQLVKDINTTMGDTAGSFPSGFTAYNGKIYFNATDGVHGYELWVTDGTANGTQMVMDIYPDTIGSNPTGFTVFNGHLYFAANDGTHGNELWVTDGTTTELDMDINPGYQSSNPQGLTAFNTHLVFQADDGMHGPELCSVTGAQTGFQLTDIDTGQDGSYPQNFFAFGNKLYFQATDSAHGAELWTTDGTPLGTGLFGDLNPGPNGSYPGFFTIYHSNLYFTAQPDSVSGAQLFFTNGTPVGTGDIIITDAPLNPLGATTGFAVVGNNLAFSGYYDGFYGQQLWFFNDLSTAVTAVDKAPAFNLYPNPCKSYYTIHGFNAGQNYTIRLTDLTGRLLQVEQIQAASQVMQFSMPQISAGLYLVEVQNDQFISTLRLVKGE